MTLPEERLVTEVTVRWYSSSSRIYGARDYDIEVWDGTVWVPVVSVRDNQDGYNRLSIAAPYLTDRLRVLLRTIILPDYDYRPLRLTDVDVTYRPLVGTTEYADTLSNGNFTFTVTAINEHGFESQPSDPASLTLGTPIVLTATVNGSDVLLEWTDPEVDINFFYLHRNGESIRTINKVRPAALSMKIFSMAPTSIRSSR